MRSSSDSSSDETDEDELTDIVAGVDGGQQASRLPVVWGICSRPGTDAKKNTNENAEKFFVKDCAMRDDGKLLAAVCDGHGPNGRAAAKFVTKRIVKAIQKEETERGTQVAIKEAFIAVNQDLGISDIDVYVSGCTCCMVYLQEGGELNIANVGDSRAMLVGEDEQGEPKTMKLSNEHRPDRPDEMARIVNAGGRVFDWGVPRVWLQDLDMPGLSMSRSFGDLAAETVGVYAEPELVQTTISASDKLLVLATDGVWEFMTESDVAELLLPLVEGGDAQDAAEQLVQEAARRWEENEEMVDDITCIVFFLYHGDAARQKEADAESIGGSSTD